MQGRVLVVEPSLVKKLLEKNFPHWKDLNLQEVKHSGTDNIIYRLGNDKIVRFSKHSGVDKYIFEENSILKKINDIELPLRVPSILGVGLPDKKYPNHWTVQSWVEGDGIKLNKLDLTKAAVDLASFLNCLRKVDVTGIRTTYRGMSLKLRSKEVEKALTQVSDLYDVRTLSKIWEKCLQVKEWEHAPMFYHADLLPGNLLMKNNHLSAVIDFGMAGSGDPSIDLMPAWSLFDRERREIFRQSMRAEKEEWIRAKGWALSVALIIIPYYLNTNIELVAIAKQIIDEILLDE